MIKLYDDNQFEMAKSTDKLPLKCVKCDKTFLKEKRIISQKKSANKYCSLKCTGLAARYKLEIKCKNCDISFNLHLSKLKKSKSGNHFCSRSCSAIYNNKNKTHGTRRSKLEIYIQNQLSLLFPELVIHYNRKETINSELDIYIPSLKLAFELNGIFHYEPIFGQDKFTQIKNNDHRKFQACAENMISLCVIDTSSLNYFKEQNAKKFLDIIVNLINNHTSNS